MFMKFIFVCILINVIYLGNANDLKEPVSVNIGDGGEIEWSIEDQDQKYGPNSEGNNNGGNGGNGNNNGNVSIQLTVTSLYTCDKNSYFRRVNRSYSSVVPSSVVRCDHLIISRYNTSAIGYRKHNKSLNLNITGYQSLNLLSNGNEINNILGTVTGGVCDGDLIYISNSNNATQGSCNSPTGVTQTSSAPNAASFVIRGQCESNCLGTLVSNYNPGKTF